MHKWNTCLHFTYLMCILTRLNRTNSSIPLTHSVTDTTRQDSAQCLLLIYYVLLTSIIHRDHFLFRFRPTYLFLSLHLTVSEERAKQTTVQMVQNDHQETVVEFKRIRKLKENMEQNRRNPDLDTYSLFYIEIQRTKN